MRTPLPRRGSALSVLLWLAWAVAADPSPYDSGRTFLPAGELDRRMLEGWRAEGVTPANLCTDEVFLRRAFVDVIGTLPTPEEVRRYRQLPAGERRSRLIEHLLDRDEFADYWSLKWCDLLRVKAEFPVNLWPNAVQAYHRWIHDALAERMPLDRFARELLTSSGSNFRVPPVNFYRAVQGQDPATLAAAAALTFMGVRLERWPAPRRRSLERLFSRVAFKGTAEWKEEIVFLDPAPAGAMTVRMPDGEVLRVGAEEDPRRAFADWLTRPENRWFARSLANRVWSWLLGRGLVHEPDDLRPDNPSAHPRALAYLADELVRSGWDLRHLFRVILGSATYQQSPVPRGDFPPEQFASYPVRRLDAEVLRDALNWLAGSEDRYQSMIPEPFTFVPGYHRSIELADGSITSHFLEMFGRPPRDTGLESERSHRTSKAQRLHLLNSSDIHDRLRRSQPLRQLARAHRRDPRELIRRLYLGVLSRPPTPVESRVALVHLRAQRGKERRQALLDLAWALVNTKEFLFRH